MKQITFSWPEGKSGALTTSWDDGTIHDRRLVGIFNAHGIKATWNLNAKWFADNAPRSNDHIKAEEVVPLYAGHEVACHGFSHPFLERIPEAAITAEIIADRAELERIVRHPVLGMALPYGTYDARVNRRLTECGILYSRTARSHNGFALPADFIEWHPTCHHKHEIGKLWDAFMADRRADKLFYLWGHSYEFDNDKNWGIIEEFSKAAGAASNVWHATNMEVCEYVTAWRGLSCSIKLDSFWNRSGTTLWFKLDGQLVSLKPNQSLDASPGSPTKE